MSVFKLELARCLVQQGSFSMSADSHRRHGGDPRIEINVGAKVSWRLFNIDHGDPQTVSGKQRTDGVDFYFLVGDREAVRTLIQSFPNTTATPDRSLITQHADPRGTERRGGKRIRPLYKIAAFATLSTVTIRHSAKAPEFEARAQDVTLHVDYELTPVSNYGSEKIELHFGVRGKYDVSPWDGQTPSQAILEMTPEFYATVIDEILRSI